jgi:hypothetical protein
MTQPLYYLPGCTQETLLDPSRRLRRNVLEARGILDIFADVYEWGADCGGVDLTGKGPDGKTGLILYYQTADGRSPKLGGYHPQLQQWRPIGDGSLAWIGIDSSDPPTAKDYRRKRLYAGFEVESPIGTIVVPIVRRPDHSTELPTDLEWDQAGNVVTPIKATYAKHYDDMREVLGWFFPTDDSPKCTMPRALELAVQAVGLNYRIGRAEQNISHVVDSSNVMPIIGATIDLDRVLRVLGDGDSKKKDSTPETPNTTHGEADDCQNTDPLTAKSI